MEHLNNPGRPRLLSDIPEIDSQASGSQHEGVPSNSLSVLRQQYSAASSSQPQAQPSNNLRKSILPSRPPPTFLNNPLSKAHRHLQHLYKPAMDGPPASAPASLRAERPVVYTPSLSLGRSRDASLTRASSATEIHLNSPSADERDASLTRASSATNIRLTLPPTDERGREPYSSGHRPPVQTGTMNLKQLTCHWWYNTGNCRFSSKDCLYAHHDTGKYAEAPRQVIPGQPAVAGRNADRKLREAENHLTSLRLDDARNMNTKMNSSSSSLADMTNQPFSASPGGVFNVSRPSTPGVMLHSPHSHNHDNGIFPIVPNSPLHLAATNAANLESEVRFFRTLVEQGGKEKEVMVSTIESLQAENQNLRATSTTISAENTRLTEERDALRGALSLLQQQQTPLSRSSTPISTLRRTTPGSASFPDFGAIGGKRFASGS